MDKTKLGEILHPPQSPTATMISVSCRACSGDQLEMLGQQVMPLNKDRVNFALLFQCKMCHQKMLQFIQVETLPFSGSPIITPR